jgi:hypothetical protein
MLVRTSFLSGGIRVNASLDHRHALFMTDGSLQEVADRPTNDRHDRDPGKPGHGIEDGHSACHRFAFHSSGSDRYSCDGLIVPVSQPSRLNVHLDIRRYATNLAIEKLRLARFFSRRGEAMPDMEVKVKANGTNSVTRDMVGLLLTRRVGEGASRRRV